MPVHDWTRVDAGTFHAFHTAWITHLSETLNSGLLPPDYYALPEQHGGRLIADVLTLQIPEPSAFSNSKMEGGVTLADHPPQVRHRLSPVASLRGSRRTLTIRHVSGHRVIAILEIVSPANKDRATHVAEFVAKVDSALWQGISVMVVDLLPPTTHDPLGMHGAIWEGFDDEPYPLPPNERLTLASYVPPPNLEAYLEHVAIGSVLIDMPLFLNAERYVNVPLEPTYQAAFQGLPKFWREVLEGNASR